MDKNDFLVTLIKREVKIIGDVGNAISNLSILDTYLKPSQKSRLGNNYYELETYSNYIERIKYLIEEEVYFKCKNVYSQYSKNLNGYGTTPIRQYVLSIRLSVVKYLTNIEIDLHNLISELENERE